MIMTDIFIDFGNKNLLCDVAFVRNEEIWTTSSFDEFLRLYKLDGKLVNIVQTKSGKVPFGISIIRFGDLVYVDNYDRSLNIVKGTEVHTMIKLQEWRPLGVCSSYSDELLLLMVNDSNNQAKVLRYSGSTEKQSIQLEDKGKPLFPPTGSYNFPICICENKHYDICVTDKKAKAVLIVDENGELQFRYTSFKRLFQPMGILTDRQSRILISDRINNLIHILNPDGRLLRYIDNCYLEFPSDLYVDKNDNLFVAESSTG